MTEGQNDANTLPWFIINASLARKVPHTSNSSQMFWNLQDQGLR